MIHWYDIQTHNWHQRQIYFWGVPCNKTDVIKVFANLDDKRNVSTVLIHPSQSSPTTLMF